jgi:hypothetical protein
MNTNEMNDGRDHFNDETPASVRESGMDMGASSNQIATPSTSEAQVQEKIDNTDSAVDSRIQVRVRSAVSLFCCERMNFIIFYLTKKGW